MLLLSFFNRGLEGAAALSDSSSPSSTRIPAVQRRSPQRLGPYELLESIGKGGMGEVYRARHLELVGREPGGRSGSFAFAAVLQISNVFSIVLNEPIFSQEKHMCFFFH